LKRLLNIILFFGLLFISCNKTNKIDTSERYIKEWKSTPKGFPFSATLKINKDNTFDYNSGACTSRSFSKGNWKLSNDTIVLNSSQPKGCFLLFDFGYYCYELSKSGLPLFKIKKSIKDCNPNENNYDVFENEKFIVVKDTLLKYIKNKADCPPKNSKYDDNFILK
jgi:hypothetical protein